MHQPCDEPFEDELPKRDAHGFLVDKYGVALDDALCEECKWPVPSPTLRFVFNKYRCSCCRRFWANALKPKPSLKSALSRARRAGVSATLVDEQWQEALEHFKHLCAYCGKNPWSCVEHATPLPYGGTTIDNCVPSCAMCNALKRGKTLEEMVNGPSTYARDAKDWEPALTWLRSKGRNQPAAAPG